MLDGHDFTASTAASAAVLLILYRYETSLQMMHIPNIRSALLTACTWLRHGYMLAVLPNASNLYLTCINHHAAWPDFIHKLAQ
jgi:hypothetical protein